MIIYIDGNNFEADMVTLSGQEPANAEIDITVQIIGGGDRSTSAW